MTWLRFLLVTASLPAALAACGDDTAPPPAPTVLVRTDAATAAECGHGGSVVRAGADRDGNGRLDAAEVVTSTPICLDAPPTPEPPPAVLTRTRDEAVGAHCALGGTAVLSGTDRDRDGGLDDDEVVHTDYVCLAPLPDDPALLTRMDAIAPGDTCLAGGIAFVVGHDDNGNGALDPVEDEHRDPRCGDVIDRDVRITSDADVALLSKIRVIAGDVAIVDGATLTHLRLPALELVRDLRVDSAAELEDIDLPALRSVRTLAVSRSALTTLRVHATSCRGTVIDIAGNPQLRDADVTCPGLEVLDLEANDALAQVHIDFGDGAEAAGRITLQSNPHLVAAHLRGGALDDLTLSRLPLTSVDLTSGDGSHPPRVTTFRAHAVDLATLPTMSGLQTLRLSETLLTALAYGELREVDLTSNRLLATVHFGGVHTDLAAYHNDALESLTLDDHQAPTGHVALVDNGHLTAAPWLGDLHRIAALAITGNPLLVAPARLDLLASEGDIQLSELPGLTSLTAELTDDAHRFVQLIATHTGLVTLHATLASTSDPAMPSEAGPIITIAHNPALTSATVDAALIRGLALAVDDNVALHDLGLDLAAQVYDLIITTNPQLPACTAQAILDGTQATHREAQSGNDDSATCTLAAVAEPLPRGGSTCIGCGVDGP